MNIVIVIPAFNEGKTLGSVVDAVRQRYSNVVVVDDASRDDTASVGREHHAVVLRHLINRGQGAALKTGIVYALQIGADAIVTFDADGQHSVDDIPLLLSPIEKKTHDVVLGSRFLLPSTNIPSLRKIILRAGVLFTRFFSHIDVTDTHNGLRAMSRDAAEKIRIVQDRMAHASEILDEIVHHRLRYTEVPVTILYTEYSKTKGQGNLAFIKIAFKFLISKLFKS